jgi:hypothetical protein
MWNLEKEGHESKKGPIGMWSEKSGRVWVIRKGNRGVEYDQSTLCACMEMS